MKVSGSPLEWLDHQDPTDQELSAIGQKYGIHRTLIDDCRDPGHRPKVERIGRVTFLLLRVYNEDAPRGADTMEELTRRIAVFLIENESIVTLHWREEPILARLMEGCRTAPPQRSVDSAGLGIGLVLDIVNEVIATYEKPLDDAERGVESFESNLFHNPTFSTSPFERIYVFKRKVMTMKRMLGHTVGLLVKLKSPLDPAFAEIPNSALPLIQDVHEDTESLYNSSNELLEDINHLLNVQISLAAHRTNEIVRVLTVFSVFFLPLTFIVGVYGMNFKHMPELEWHYGYPATLVLMFVICLVIYLWFRRKGWMK